MGKWKYKKKESSLVQGVCVVCEQRQQKRRRRRNNIVYLPYCRSCERTLYPSSKPIGYRKFKNICCDACGFIPLHKCQLDVDHIDGDHSNNNPDNLQTLCANCHRLKTYIQLWDPLLEKIE
jgi:5-methylcytosine-specific restriction endonuclease McrA